MTSGDRIIQLLDSYPSTGSAFRWYRQKPNGEARPMATPNAALKKWQRDMNTALNKHFSSWPDFMHGGIKKRSYVSFAQPHVDKPYVITIDVKQCFDSITVREVSMAMKRHLELSTDVCRRLANKLCFRGKIAQGFPTSNYICNLYLLGPLTSLQSSLKEQGIEFGNYVKLPLSAAPCLFSAALAA